jgi:ABC-type lipoprotein export system ATPase subunit
MALIELNDICKTYHMGDVSVPVLKGVSLKVDRGEQVALTGASGSGKSTLMNLLGFLDRPTAGQYRFDGDEVSQLSVDQRALLRNQQLGFVFQNFQLLPRTSAIENVSMPLAYAPDQPSQRECHERAEVLLRRVGLGDRMDHQPSQMSGGEQQRVAIARALINNPQVLLADEPTGNLDSHTSEDVLRLFDELNEEHDITVIIVTHDADVAEHAKRVIHIHDGQVLDGMPDAVKRGGER